MALPMALPMVMGSSALAAQISALPVIAAADNEGAPRLHSARVVGATPGRPFLFLIAATGAAPFQFSARDLPAGLILDENTGVISGALTYAGASVVRLEARNSLGAATRNLTIVGGRHLLAQTPPMGWNSWNAYGCGVTGARVRRAAADLVSSGLARRGYNYVNVDDCWQGARAASGQMQSNARLGDMAQLGRDIHARGLKFGLYSSPGPRTCAGFEGSWRHEFDDAATYASWGVDYLKYDYCTYDQVAQEVGRARAIAPFARMRDALDVAGRDIVYSVCQYGKNQVWQWAALPPVSADLWRTSRDVKGNYGSVARIGFGQGELFNFGGPGRWNDPDMLYLHRLGPHEQLTQMTLWSLLAAPLLIGSDIGELSPFSLDVLSNSEVIEVDQDPLGIGARRVAQSGATQVWARPLWDGTLAVGLFNRGNAPAKVAARWSDLKIGGARAVRDLWRQREIGDFASEYAVEVAPHGAVLIRVGTPQASDYVPQWMNRSG